MNLYTSVSYDASRRLTLAYSTSFSKSITFFSKTIQPHIFALYGLVRIADEIVDVYQGPDKLSLLNVLEKEVYDAIKRSYSANPIVHSFALTAKLYGISDVLIRPFFESMAMDIQPKQYDQPTYERYIYGSAEVVGLMCLRVFVNGDEKEYTRLEKGARALGAAYQKINFLRDMAADYKELGRTYFPGIHFETFNDIEKHHIVRNITRDISNAKRSLSALPITSRHAVELSLTYYQALLDKLNKTSADTIKQKRVRINSAQKAALLTLTTAKRTFRV
jgi:phytoene synthase